MLTTARMESRLDRGPFLRNHQLSSPCVAVQVKARTWHEHYTPYPQLSGSCVLRTARGQYYRPPAVFLLHSAVSKQTQVMNLPIDGCLAMAIHEFPSSPVENHGFVFLGHYTASAFQRASNPDCPIYSLQWSSVLGHSHVSSAGRWGMDIVALHYRAGAAGRYSGWG